MIIQRGMTASHGSPIAHNMCITLVSYDSLERLAGVADISLPPFSLQQLACWASEALLAPLHRWVEMFIATVFPAVDDLSGGDALQQLLAESPPTHPALQNFHQFCQAAQGHVLQASALSKQYAEGATQLDQALINDSALQITLICQVLHHVEI